MFRIANYIPLALAIVLLLPSSAVYAVKPHPGAKKPTTISQPRNVRDAGRGGPGHSSRKEMVASAKAALKRGKATLKTARKDLKAAIRSEKVNRTQREKAKQAMDAAKNAYRANKTQANFQKWQSAYNAYLPVREKHESALSMKRAQENNVQQLVSRQLQTAGAIRQGNNLKPRPPRAGQPRFGAQRPTRFGANHTYDRVPSMRIVYDKLGPAPMHQNAYASPGSAMIF